MRLGDWLRREDATKETTEAYLAAVSEKMPQEGEDAQHIHLQLGALFFKKGEIEKSRSHLWKAQQGPNELLKKRAKEQLNQVDIDEYTTKMKTVVGNI
jgi:hypothetical protein